MVQLTLSAEETEVLRELLRVSISDLRSEVVHTDSYDYRERLKAREATLKRILQSLPAAQT